MPFLVRRVNNKKQVGILLDTPIGSPRAIRPQFSFSQLDAEENKLSVWQVDDDQSNLDEVITALASVRSDVASIDFAILERAKLDAAGFILEKIQRRFALFVG